MQRQKSALSLSICVPCAVIVWLVVFCATADMSAGDQSHSSRKSGACATLMIQGRILAIKGGMVSVKTPDAYPGGQGVHPQFVVRGPVFKADVAGARVLLPNGTQPDPKPLAVGEQVVMLLCGPPPGSGTPAPFAPEHTYAAEIIQRLMSGDKVITH